MVPGGEARGTLKKGGESKNLELEMGQTDLLLIVLFCFGHKQS